MSRSLRMLPVLLLILVVEIQARGQSTARPIRMIEDPALSPDGKLLAFSHLGDVWIVDSAGGRARRVTSHPATDRNPAFSPDGSLLAFISDRDAPGQIHVVPVEGGAPTRVTLNTEGYDLEEWLPDGSGFLVRANRDHHWRSAGRFFIRPLDPHRAESLLFDAEGREGRLSRDGRRLLYTREGAPLYRKGYHGSQESQVWIFDRTTREHRLLYQNEGGSRTPLWGRGEDEILHVSAAGGSFNLVAARLGGEHRALSRHEDDSVLFPAVSRDGRIVVYRHLFDLYRVDLEAGTAPVRITIDDGGDPTVDAARRAVVQRASDVSFSPDGKEIAFTAAGDLFVMDTELLEPRRITATPEEEREPLFLDNGTILFVTDSEGRTDVGRARRSDTSRWFWQQERFEIDRLTGDEEVESRLTPVPGPGNRFAFVRGRGDLWVAGPDGKDARRLLESWNAPQFSFSPDGRWLAYAIEDGDFNSDVWIAPMDGSAAPFNLSCHPDNDGNPVWSADGKVLAFTGRRWGEEVDVAWVNLEREIDEETARDRKLEKALEKMKGRKDPSHAEEPGKDGDKPAGGEESGNEEKKRPARKNDDKGAKTVEVKIDFEGIRDRIRRLSIPDSFERGLIFWPEGRKLLFSSNIDGKSGIYAVEFPDELKPKLFADAGLGSMQVLSEAKLIGGVQNGSAATLDAKGKVSTYAFRKPIEYEVAALHRAVFDQAWKLMRDGFYDERLGNRNWDEVRRKYSDAAAACVDARSLAAIGNMMLGELNGSHLGFNVNESAFLGAAGAERGTSWRPQTGHLGLLFDAAHQGPGLLVKEVIEGSPAWRERSKIAAGETLLAIEGKNVDPALEIADFLTLEPDQEIRVRVRGADGAERDVLIRPTSYGAIRGLLYERWVRANRAMIARLSGGKLGYLHIRGMNLPSLLQFDEELYREGFGKDGLVIDVRENGGGSTADHLLTCLTQPEHALTRPRGAPRELSGYPQDRRIYATWSKPIVVLCNQNSFSNAEIFSHAIKTLGRGKLVGVPTAGGVISTGSATIMGGLATIRMPFRGWYLLGDGEDMELNGCVPDAIVWPKPEEQEKGIDRQIEKAVELLAADVAAAAAKPRPVLRKASER